MIPLIRIAGTSNEIEDIFHYPLLCYPVQNTKAISTMYKYLSLNAKHDIYCSVLGQGYLDPLSNHRTLYTINLDLLTTLRIQPQSTYSPREVPTQTAIAQRRVSARLPPLKQPLKNQSLRHNLLRPKKYQYTPGARADLDYIRQN